MADQLRRGEELSRGFQGLRLRTLVNLLSLYLRIHSNTNGSTKIENNQGRGVVIRGMRHINNQE